METNDKIDMLPMTPNSTPDTIQPKKLKHHIPQQQKMYLALAAVFLVSLPLLMVAVLTATRLNSRASNLRLTVTPVTPPTPTCKPRPACLDAQPHPCKIPDTGFCPPTPTPSPTCKPRPACLDAKNPCKIKDIGYCPRPTPSPRITPQPVPTRRVTPRVTISPMPVRR